jgi:hypothetical protein
MSRISFYIDGLNVYHALNNKRYRKYKWLDYRKLAEAIVRPEDVLVDVLYFTTYARWRPDSFARHKLYMKALRSRGGKRCTRTFYEAQKEMSYLQRVV